MIVQQLINIISYLLSGEEKVYLSSEYVQHEEINNAELYSIEFSKSSSLVYHLIN